MFLLWYFYDEAMQWHTDCIEKSTYVCAKSKQYVTSDTTENMNKDVASRGRHRCKSIMLKHKENQNIAYARILFNCGARRSCHCLL